MLPDVSSEVALRQNAKFTRDINTWPFWSSCNLIDHRRRTLAEMKWTDWTWTSTTRRRTSSSASPPSSSSSPSLAAVAPGKWAIDLLLLQRWLFETYRRASACWAPTSPSSSSSSSFSLLEASSPTPATSRTASGHPSSSKTTLSLSLYRQYTCFPQDWVVHKRYNHFKLPIASFQNCRQVRRLRHGWEGSSLQEGLEHDPEGRESEYFSNIALKNHSLLQQYVAGSHTWHSIRCYHTRTNWEGPSLPHMKILFLKQPLKSRAFVHIFLAF